MRRYILRSATLINGIFAVTAIIYLQNASVWYIISSMINFQVTGAGELTKVNSQCNLEHVDNVKVKITKCLITGADIADYLGLTGRETPFTPSKIATAQITETLQESNYFTKGTKVFLAPETYYDLPVCEREKGLVSSNDGFLKEFAVVPKKFAHILPQNVTENDALFIYHINLALSVIDSLTLEKGEYVAIVGGNILANIIAQLVSYYKAVPVVIDENDENLELAAKTDVYYTLKTSKNLESEILSITGGRRCRKAVYITDSETGVDIIGKVSSDGAKTCVTGFYETNEKFSLAVPFNKQLEIKFVRGGVENVGTAINLLAQKALQLNYYDLSDYKLDYVQKHFENHAEKFKNGSFKEFSVNLL